MDELTVSGTLVRGMKVGEQVHKDFVMREANATARR